MALVGEGSTSDTPDGGELPHAQDRLWRHPAERGAEQAAANLAARKTGGRNWSNHIMSFIAGGAVVGLVWLLQTEPEVPVAQNTVIEFADRPVADTVPDRLSFDVWVEDVARPNRMSVVSLHLAGDVEQNLAQSVRLGTDGHLITSAHAIAGAEEIWAALPDGDSIPARLVAADQVSGVAVLKINATELPPPIFASTDDISIGDQLVALSHQDENGDGARAIVLLGERQVVTTPNGEVLSGLLRLSNEIDQGWAGSAVLEENGGIVAITVDSRSGAPYAIPIEQAREVAVQLLESGTVDYRAWLGVELTDLAEGIKEERELLGGVLITRVWNETPSARAGLVAGDIIVGVGPVNVIDRQDLVEYLATREPGEEVEIRYSRFQSSQNLAEQAVGQQEEEMPAIFDATVTLGARPA